MNASWGNKSTWVLRPFVWIVKDMMNPGDDLQIIVQTLYHLTMLPPTFLTRVHFWVLSLYRYRYFDVLFWGLQAASDTKVVSASGFNWVMNLLQDLNLPAKGDL